MTLTIERERPATAAPPAPEDLAQRRDRDGEEGRGPDGRLQVRRPARDLAALLDPASRSSTEGPLRATASASTARRIRGFQKIHESDMLLMPDPTTAFIDPGLRRPDAQHHLRRRRARRRAAATRRDPRYVAKKAEAYLKKTGIATTAYFGPGGRVLHLQRRSASTRRANSGFYYIDSEEGIWNTGTANGKPNLGYRPRYKEGYFPVPPIDKLQDLRSEMVLRDGVGRASRSRSTTTRSAPPARPRSTCASAPLVKHGRPGAEVQVHRQERLPRRTATPRPSCRSRSSATTARACTPTRACGRTASNLFYDKEGYALLSETGSPLHRRPAEARAGDPGLRRADDELATAGWCPGYEAPINLVYSQRNRSACVRIPTYSTQPEGEAASSSARPDPSCNPYLAFSAMLMAGLDGVEQQDRAAGPDRRGPVRAGEETVADRSQTPGSARARCWTRWRPTTTSCCEGGVFTQDLIETWIGYKRERELEQVALRPHPYEFHLYSTCKEGQMTAVIQWREAGNGRHWAQRALPEPPRHTACRRPHRSRATKSVAISRLGCAISRWRARTTASER